MELTRRNAITLSLLILAFTLVIFLYPRPSIEETYRKNYVYSTETIKQTVNDDLEIQLNIMRVDMGDFIAGDMSLSWWSYYNFTIVNKSTNLLHVYLNDDYYDVNIVQGGQLLYNIRQGFSAQNESQIVTLPSEGYHSNPKWIGAKEYITFTGNLPYGSYEILGVFRFNSTEYHLEGLTLDILKEGPITRPD